MQAYTLIGILIHFGGASLRQILSTPTYSVLVCARHLKGGGNIQTSVAQDSSKRVVGKTRGYPISKIVSITSAPVLITGRSSRR
jgi:hypothetical protein